MGRAHAHDGRVLRHQHPGVRGILAVQHRHGAARRGRAHRTEHDDRRGRVLRSDQLVPRRHHRTAQHVRHGTARHRQIHVRAPPGMGHVRPRHERDHPRRPEAGLRRTRPAARRTGHPSGQRPGLHQPARPGRHPRSAQTAHGRRPRGPARRLPRTPQRAHGGAADHQPHRTGGGTPHRLRRGIQRPVHRAQDPVRAHQGRSGAARHPRPARPRQTGHARDPRRRRVRRPRERRGLRALDPRPAVQPPRTREPDGTVRTPVLRADHRTARPVPPRRLRHQRPRAGRATTSSPPCSPPHGRARSPRRTRPT